MRESAYQAHIIKRLQRLYPNCLILKNDSDYLQGVPDLTVFVGHVWFMLEVKTSATAEQQPNQEHWIRHLNEMSFASFIYPENELDVLNAIQLTLESRGITCFS